RAAQLFAQEQTSSIIAKLTITIAAAVAAAVVPVEGSSNPGSPISSYLQFLRDGTSASNDLCPMSHDAKSLRTSGTVLPLTFRFSISIEAMVGVVPVPGLKASMVVFHPPNAGEMPPLPDRGPFHNDNHTDFGNENPPKRGPHNKTTEMKTITTRVCHTTVVKLAVTISPLHQVLNAEAPSLPHDPTQLEGDSILKNGSKRLTLESANSAGSNRLLSHSGEPQ
ncbi:hypothetical protein JG688_00010486, partial [Phytophthora aleatoria]